MKSQNIYTTNHSILRSALVQSDTSDALNDKTQYNPLLPVLNGYANGSAPALCNVRRYAHTHTHTLAFTRTQTAAIRLAAVETT